MIWPCKSDGAFLTQAAYDNLDHKGQELLTARAEGTYKDTTCHFPKIKIENMMWNNERKDRLCVWVCK